MHFVLNVFVLMIYPSVPTPTATGHLLDGREPRVRWQVRGQPRRRQGRYEEDRPCAPHNGACGGVRFHGCRRPQADKLPSAEGAGPDGWTHLGWGHDPGLHQDSLLGTGRYYSQILIDHIFLFPII